MLISLNSRAFKTLSLMIRTSGVDLDTDVSFHPFHAQMFRICNTGVYCHLEFCSLDFECSQLLWPLSTGRVLLSVTCSLSRDLPANSVVHSK